MRQKVADGRDLTGPPSKPCAAKHQVRCRAGARLRRDRGARLPDRPGVLPDRPEEGVGTLAWVRTGKSSRTATSPSSGLQNSRHRERSSAGGTGAGRRGSAPPVRGLLTAERLATLDPGLVSGEHPLGHEQLPRRVTGVSRGIGHPVSAAIEPTACSESGVASLYVTSAGEEVPYSGQGARITASGSVTDAVLTGPGAAGLPGGQAAAAHVTQSPSLQRT